MTPSDRTAAQTALNAGRATYARLDQIRGPEDTAADLVELWSAVESAMRAMMGGSSLSGQQLVREVRQRGLISLDQANALVSFADARARVDTTSYKPTLTDVGYARVGFNELTKALEQPFTSSPITSVSNGDVAGDTQPSTGNYTPHGTPYAAASAAGGSAPSAAWQDSGPVARPRKKIPTALLATIGAIVVIAAVLSYFLFGRSSYERDMERAIASMQSGQTESARAQFIQIVGEHPEESDPHVFLSRLARNDGDLVTARRELVTAIQRNETNGLAMREMGMLFLAENNPEMARRFLYRAVKADANDLAAQGYLGCALMRLNRIEEGQRFLTRAGAGNWSSCATQTAMPIR